MNIKTDHLTKPRRTLVAQALAKGYNVTQTGNLELFILSGKTTRSRGVIMFQDGSIFRTGIGLDHAKEMPLSVASTFLNLRTPAST